MIYLFAPVLKLTVYAFGCQAELSSKLASFSLASQAPQVTEPLAASIVPAKTHCTAVASISGTTSGKSGVAYTPWRRPCIQVLSVPKCSEAGGCWIVKEAGSDAPPPGDSEVNLCFQYLNGKKESGAGEIFRSLSVSHASHWVPIVRCKFPRIHFIYWIFIDILLVELSHRHILCSRCRQAALSH